MDATVTLYRPTGPKELQLVAESGYRAWPPRLTGQPIFYPVLNEEYATQIARDWNAKDRSTGYRGFVTLFKVQQAFLARYEVHRVGGPVHDEYWIPAEDLDEFNRNIVGPIEVIAEYAGGPDHEPRQAQGHATWVSPSDRHVIHRGDAGISAVTPTVFPVSVGAIAVDHPGRSTWSCPRAWWPCQPGAGR